MKKKILFVVVCFLVLLGVTTGCDLKKTSEQKSDEKTESKSKGKCDVFECIERLDANNTLEEINEVIGFEGELTSDEEKYKVYTWELTEDTSIKVQFTYIVSAITNETTTRATISANFPGKMIPKTADFSKWNEIKTKLDNKESLTYDEFVKLVGGTEGKMKQKTQDSVSYTWYNAENGYLTATFDIETKKCTMATGRF